MPGTSFGFYLCVVLSFVTIFGVHQSHGAPTGGDTASSHSHDIFFRTVPPECGFTGTSDLYGLGIRSGIYLQWFSGLIANSFEAESVISQLDTNTIFVVALFAALGIFTTNQTMKPVEVVIILQFCFGFLFAVLSLWGMRVKARSTAPKQYGKRPYFSFLGSSFRVWLAGAICFYNAWFWFQGLDRLPKESCQTTVFLFAPVDVFGAARVFFKICSVAAAVTLGLATMIELDLFLFNWLTYAFIGFSVWIYIARSRFHRLYKSSKPNHRLFASLKYWMAVFFGIPWNLANADIDAGFSRLQSFVVRATISLALLSMLSIAFATFLLSAFEFLMKPFQPTHDKSFNSSKGHVESAGAPPRPKGNTNGDNDPNKRPKERIIPTTETCSSPKVLDLARMPTLPVPADSETSENNRNSSRALKDTTYGDEQQDANSKESVSIQNNTQSQQGSSGTRGPITDKRIRVIRSGWKGLGKFNLTSYLHSSRAFWVIPALNLAFTVWSIISIELTLKWNRIDGVNDITTVGQLIPFIIGVVGF